MPAITDKNDRRKEIAAAVIRRRFLAVYNLAQFSVEKSKELVNLQENIINRLNPIRDGMRKKDKDRLADTSGDMRTNLVEYGYRSIGNSFNPHLTFTRFKDGKEHTFKTLPRT